MPRKSLRFPRGLRTWFWGSFAVLFITGVLWLVLHYLGRTEDESGLTTHSMEPWLLKLHGLAAFLALMVLGAVYVRHVLPAWHAKRNRGSGLILTGSLGLLILSGYGLYYFSGESLRTWTSYLHDVLGVALPLIVVIHIWRGRSQQPTKDSPAAHRKDADHSASFPTTPTTPKR